MKRSFLLLVAALAGFSTSAQVELGPGTPAVTLPVKTAFTNQFGIGYTINDLSTLLGTLQTNIEVTLPALDAFNNSFDFLSVGIGNAGVAPGTPLPTGGYPVGAGSRNFGASFGTNFANNSGAHLGANLATPTTAVNTSAATTSTPQVMAGFAASPISRERLRALLLLQEEMEEALSLLQGLNNDTNAPAVLPLVVPGALTGNFGTLTNQFVTPLGNNFVTPLTPTGR